MTLKQEEIIKLLETKEWEIATTSGWHTSCWIQKGGIGKGGESYKVNRNTFNALFKKGLLIRAGNIYGPQIYRLK
jgi:hypothetical protein